MATAFVSGHLDLSKEEFEEHYVPQLEAALARGDDFIVCDARGCDFMAQRWLWSHGARARVFHMLSRPRHSFGSGHGSRDPNAAPSGGGFPLVGGFHDDAGRDAECVRQSDYTIAWVRPGRERSGTARNLARGV